MLIKYRDVNILLMLKNKAVLVNMYEPTSQDAFITSDNKTLITSDNKNFIVKE